MSNSASPQKPLRKLVKANLNLKKQNTNREKNMTLSSNGENDSSQQRVSTQRKLTYTLTKSLPKPKETTEEDYEYLTPLLEKQNQKLSGQVNSLLEMFEMYSLKLFSKKNEKPQQSNLQLTNYYHENDKTLKKKYGQIRNYRREIGNIQKQLQETYSIQKIAEMQNEIALKQNNFKTLYVDGKRLDTYIKRQENTLKELDKRDRYQEQVDELTQELKSYKQQYRQKYYQQIEFDKEMMERHQALIAYDHKVREMEKQLKDYEIHKYDYDLADHKQDVEELKQEILLTKQNTLEKKQQSKSRLLKQEQKIEKLEQEVKILEIKAREKDQESRLADLKLKELQRTLKLNKLSTKCSTPKQYFSNPDIANIHRQGFNDSIKILRNKRDKSKLSSNQDHPFHDDHKSNQKFSDDALFITQKNMPVSKKNSRNELQQYNSSYQKYIIQQQYEIEENISEDINPDEQFNFNVPKLPKVNVHQKQIMQTGIANQDYPRPGKTLVGSASQPTLKKPFDVRKSRKISNQNENQQFEAPIDSYRQEDSNRNKHSSLYAKPKPPNIHQ